MSSGRSSGTRWSRERSASVTSKSGVSPPSGAPLPIRPNSSSPGCTTTRSPARALVTSDPTQSTTPAISWPRHMGVSPGPASPPILMYERSLPQMPHAATRTTTSRGPGSGVGTSSTRTSPGPWMRTWSSDICSVNSRLGETGTPWRGASWCRRSRCGRRGRCGGRRMRRGAIPGSPAELHGAPGTNQCSGVPGQVLGPEADVMQVRVLVADPDRPGQLLDELQVRLVHRVTHRGREHDILARAVAVVDRVEAEDGSPGDTDELGELRLCRGEIGDDDTDVVVRRQGSGAHGSR